MSSHRRVAAAAIAACLLAGCATPTFMKAYDGPELPKDQVALLKPTVGVQILAINGDERFAVKTSQAVGYLDVEMALPPGKHKIEVMLNLGGTRSLESIVLDLDARPGRKYLITYTWLYYTFTPKIEDRTDRPDEWCATGHRRGGCKPG